MTKQELKQLISEIDSINSRIDSIQHMLEGEGIDEGGRKVLTSQSSALSLREVEIQDILDASGEDLEALRKEVF